MKYSNFHITVNFNVDDEAHIHAMRAAVEEMAAVPSLWRWLKQYTPNQTQVDFTQETQDDVHRVRLRAAFEHEGKHNKGLHVHILVEVTHTTMVQVSKDGVAGIFRDQVHMTPNVHCRFVAGNGEDKDFILHYITKEVPSYRPKDQNNDRLRYAFGGGNEEVEAEL